MPSIAKAIADGQYDVATQLLAEMKRIAEHEAGNVVAIVQQKAQAGREP